MEEWGGAATAATLSELDGAVVTFKEDLRAALRAFSQWTRCFYFTPDSQDISQTWQRTTGQGHVTNDDQ